MKKRTYLYCASIILILSAFLRLYHLNQPNDVIFDEVYFPVFANNYLSGTDFFDAHPPLGKLILSQIISLFGNNPLGWRIGNALLGTSIIGLASLIIYSVTKRPLPSFFVLVLFATDPMLLVESRVGLINIYLGFFTLLGIWQFWRWWENPQRTLSLVIGLVSLGSAGAVKWVGFGALAAIMLFFFFTRWTSNQRQAFRPWHVWLMFVIPALVYIFTFIPDAFMRYGTDLPQGINYFKWWHTSAFNYHAHLTATHPYGSQWWSWPVSLRPLWMYYKALPEGRIIGLFEPGNVVTWIAGILALAVMGWRLIQKKEVTFVWYLIVTYLVLFLPWSIIGRVKFIYHYFVPVLILHCISALALEKVFQSKYKYAVPTVLGLGTAFFIYYLPLLMGLTISQQAYKAHILWRSWI